ncbi:hypothetical protein BDZ85DRAFT_78397 [Elsinoe ampelina]|uniref:Uncharacterized protein n=1 Tax=Elsinoe ampelina TaxID=302913 RepID=A0A6A6FZ36_9PEZI|nr:hypothetical protein BDZ85DRAFT_78397 [Elsinoe ampelina]
MGSLHILSSDGYEIPICLPTKTGDDWHTLVCSPVIIELMQLEKLKPQAISKRDIQDRNKADSFTKVFTLAQSTWFVFQSLARVVAHLPISPLEVSALAYVFCTAVTYLCWWSKPKDVLTVLKLSDPLCVAVLPDDLQDRIKQYDSHQGVACHYRWKVFRLPSTEAEILAVIRQRWPALVGLITGIIFCCIHLSAWNFSFPTETEKILWWACSIASATVPLLSFIAVFLRSLSPKRFDSLWPLVLAIYCTIMLIYIMCRLILCVIMLTTMRYLPEGSFTSINWALRFPHI